MADGGAMLEADTYFTPNCVPRIIIGSFIISPRCKLRVRMGLLDRDGSDHARMDGTGVVIRAGLVELV